MTRISSTTANACTAAMVCWMIGLPAILISCLGMLRPTRVPVPPASDDGHIAQLAEGGHSRTVSADQQGSAQASTLAHLVTHR